MSMVVVWGAEGNFKKVIVQKTLVMIDGVIQISET
jgi:hypothetical protein